MGNKFNTPTEQYILLKTPCQAALGSETGFPLWGEKKARIRARRFRFFRALFSSRFREKSSGAHLWSITNTKHSTIIRKNLKSLLVMPIGIRTSCLMKKTGGKKSCDTIPLNILIGETRRAVTSIMPLL
jgi:hypothetical protein